MDKFYNDKGEEIQRTRTKIFSRVNGWITSIDTWNKGKVSEWNARLPYSIKKHDSSSEQ